MSWLITGFEPFNGETINPSAILAQSLSRKLNAESLILPVSYEKSFEVLKAKLETGRYHGLFALGQAGGRRTVCLERVALNLEDSEWPDADGQLRVEKKIEDGGPHAIMNPLPLRELIGQLKSRVGPLIEISSSAGTYVCNSLYYKMFRWQQESPEKLAWQLFVHVPYLPEQVLGKDEKTPFLSQMVMEQALMETFRQLRELFPPPPERRVRA